VDSGPLAAINAGAALDLNITLASQVGEVEDRVSPRLRQNLRGTVEDVVFYVVNNVAPAPSAVVTFWGNDSHNLTNLNAIKCWGKESLSASDFVREASGLTTSIWIAHVGGLAIPYSDLDGTGEFHITVENEYAGTNFGANKSRLEFGFRPEFGG